MPIELQLIIIESKFVKNVNLLKPVVFFSFVVAHIAYCCVQPMIWYLNELNFATCFVLIFCWLVSMNALSNETDLRETK